MTAPGETGAFDSLIPFDFAATDAETNGRRVPFFASPASSAAAILSSPLRGRDPGFENRSTIYIFNAAGSRNVLARGRSPIAELTVPP
jgi:hypothetical protein